jgi:copper(I)-binding protein
MKPKATILLAVVCALLVATCGPRSGGGIEIQDAWGRPSPQSAENAAFYMIIKNTSSEADALIGAQSTACGMTELHETSMDAQGVMQMNPVERIEIPAGGQVELAVGGLHVMCMHKQVEFAPGTSVSLTLTFEKAGERAIQLEIREP